MKLGVITDGISTDLEHALQVMNEHELEYAELQFVWDKEVGDHSAEEIKRMKSLIKQHGVKVVSITRHNFAGLPIKETTVEAEAYKKHMEGLKRCIAMARELETDTVRIMSGRKEMIIFGENGAEKWVASTGSWDKLLELMQPPLKLAESEGITLAVETGNNAMITSGYLARKFIDDMGSKNPVLYRYPLSRRLRSAQRTYLPHPRQGFHRKYRPGDGQVLCAGNRRFGSLSGKAGCCVQEGRV